MKEFLEEALTAMVIGEREPGMKSERHVGKACFNRGEN